jgi:uncharacterized YigZ family protein
LTRLEAAGNIPAMPKRYLIPAGFHRVEESIKKSRFITSLGHAPDVEAAREFVAAVKAEFPDATHNCWAFNAGPPGDTAMVGLSDDGEPSGTAGRPMLTTLLHADVGEIAVVVTRYFGGTKLGTGGLVRAYSSMVNLGLDSLPTREMVETATLEATIPYPAVTLFKRMLPDFEAEVTDEAFTDIAGFTLVLPMEHLDGFTSRVAELTDGRGVVLKK